MREKYKDVEEELGMDINLIPKFMLTFQKFNSKYFSQIVPSYPGKNFTFAFYVKDAFFGYVMIDTKKIRKVSIKNDLRVKLQKIIKIFQDNYGFAEFPKIVNYKSFKNEVENIFEITFRREIHY